MDGPTTPGAGLPSAGRSSPQGFGEVLFPEAFLASALSPHKHRNNSIRPPSVLTRAGQCTGSPSPSASLTSRPGSEHRGGLCQPQASLPEGVCVPADFLLIISQLRPAAPEGGRAWECQGLGASGSSGRASGPCASSGPSSSLFPTSASSPLLYFNGMRGHDRRGPAVLLLGAEM